MNRAAELAMLRASAAFRDMKNINILCPDICICLHARAGLASTETERRTETA
jgi:hypothetical protein